MPRIPITSLDEPGLAPYRDLKGSKRHADSRWFIAESPLLVERLLASAFEVESVLVSERLADRFPPGAPDELPIFVAPDELIRRIVGFKFHRGAMACGRRRPLADVEELARDLRGGATLVVCGGVQIGENLGSILRTAAALGADGLVIDQGCADPFARRTLRVSMGAPFRLPLARSDDLAADLRRLREAFGFELAATVTDEDAERLESFRRGSRLAVVFGGEGFGLDDELLELCDRRLTIPMGPGTDSLNVSVAAGVFLYYCLRGGGG